MKRPICALAIGAVAASFAGMALAASDPIPGVDIVVKRIPPRGSLRVVPTGEPNVFQIEVTEPGSYTIQVTQPNAGPAQQGPLRQR